MGIQYWIFYMVCLWMVLRYHACITCELTNSDCYTDCPHSQEAVSKNMNKLEKTKGLRGITKELFTLQQKAKAIQDKLDILKSGVTTQAIEAAIALARNKVQEEIRETGF
jgi:pyruvate dehydrogenase complex dehydrogenase (E1) component